MIPTGLKPYAYLAIALALVVSHAWAWRQGGMVNDAAWTKRENADLLYANKRIKELVTEREKKQKAHDERIAELASEHQKEIQDAKAQRDRDIAAARAGALRLRIPTAIAGSDRSPSAEAIPAACVGNGGSPGELPGEVASNLLEFAHDADEVARQLATCQAVILEDRRLCNGGE